MHYSLRSLEALKVIITLNFQLSIINNKESPASHSCEAGLSHLNLINNFLNNNLYHLILTKINC